MAAVAAKLTVKEYAELKGCTVRYVRKMITSKQLKADEIPSDKGGRGGVRYIIPLSSCPPEIVKKYNRLHKADHPAAGPEMPSGLPKSMEELSEKERKEATMWKTILKKWQEYRNGYPGNKTEADKAYVEQLKAEQGLEVTASTLYRKKEKLDKYGICALADGRGKHENHKKAIPEEVFGIFEFYYLDQSKKTVAECMRLTELELERIGREDLLPLASASTFAREIARRPGYENLLIYYREGEKAYEDKCMPYIKRNYGGLMSNDLWVCDNHTFDILVDGGGDRPVRLYLTAFMDVRSRKMMGWYVTDTPCADATLQALRRGIERYGIPKQILSDNGREFVVHDIGGRGFRKSLEDEHHIQTILERLEIEFRTALPKNAKAKTIERAFREVKECFSRLLEGYTGGNILERPERLKELEKDVAGLTVYADFERYVDVYLEGWYNYQSSTGAGMGGKTRNEVYAENLYEKRIAPPDDLNLMLMRNSRMVTVGRNGVTMRIYGTEIQFRSDDLIRYHIGERVYYRYNPDDLSEVRVYDARDRFLGTAQQLSELGYFASKEEVAERMREKRRLKRTIAAYKKEKGIEAEDALALVMAAAERNLEQEERLQPRITTLIRAAGETPVYSDAFEETGDSDPIDWEAALERMQRAKGLDT